MAAHDGRTAEAVTLVQGRRFVVVDNALSPDALAAWREEERAVQHRPTFSSVDPMFDGVAFYADASYASAKAGEEHAGEVTSAVRRGLDALGVTAEDNDRFKFWRYGRGSGLDWHDDGSGRGAAYTLYLSGEWRATWGGELELFDCPVGEVPCAEFDVPKDLMNAPVPATSIAPRPNRLVVMVAGTFHRVRKVEAGAGDNLRRSITGFLTP
ncbi:2OG-Fe(II) oxygenase [Nonomuraea jiangxiensis]|uniref:2OG-Fe(II) oxygenase superfamily protein n=1 Tax=Nonomuraea jiangxiensis TaxID=633440 RepID=A0A1G9HZI8_9ACTN|nr:2OG-Fe(II) oxygenase [Nonomuraea jiangxiensis]SDL18379.1 2OG-Fe(II) oxygenase superfamily protein [Nonomuraea jiangxiensis]